MDTIPGRFLVDEGAVTAIEYGLIALFVSLLLMSAAGSAGLHLKHLLHLAAALSSKGPPGLH
jgi:Flp pilus assembly pilin Flp